MAGESITRTRYLLGDDIVPYTLVDGYPTFKFSDETSTASERYIIHKDDMMTMQLICMPPPIIFGGRPIIPQRRSLPGTAGLTVKSLEFRPMKADMPQDPFEIFGDIGRRNDYMFVDLEYETTPYDEEDPPDEDDPTTFLEVGFDTTAEFLKVPVTRTNFITKESESRWGTPQTGRERNPRDINNDNEIPATIVIPTTTYMVNWKLALNPNFVLFRSLIGRLNQLVDPLFFNAPKETILFAGYSGKRSFLWNGRTTTVTPWDLTFKFVGKHVEGDAGTVVEAAVAGWNHVYRPSTGKWERIRKADGKYLYGTTSTFQQMFESGGLI